MLCISPALVIKLEIFDFEEFKLEIFKLKVFKFYFESLAGISPSPGPLILEYALVGVNSTIAYSRRRKFCESENR